MPDGQSSMSKRKSVPLPGRPQSLGSGQDLADAAALLAVIRAASDVRLRRRAGSTHVARQALWSFWELPRLPRPVIASKYPLAYPWSPAAREVYVRNQPRPVGGWGLVLEHLTPRNLLLEGLFTRAKELDAQELIDELSVALIATIVTKTEDLALTNAGFGFSQPEGADPSDLWARYTAAGLTPAGFAPIDQSEADE